MFHLGRAKSRVAFVNNIRLAKIGCFSMADLGFGSADIA